jgi:CHAT domain-containing protein
MAAFFLFKLVATERMTTSPMAQTLRVVFSLLVCISMYLPVQAAAQQGILQNANQLSSQASQAFQEGQYQSAVRLGQQALQIATQREFPDLIWRVQVLLGESYLKLGQTDNAEQAFRGAQAAVDLVNGSLSGDSAKQQFGVGKSQITSRLIDFDIAANNPAQLFEDAERGRARAFVDLLTETELSLSDDRETNQRVRTLDEKIRTQRFQFSLQRPGSKRGAAIKSEINDLMEQRAKLMDQLAAINTEWAAAYSVRYATLQQVQARLSKREMLVYSVSGSNPNDIYLLFVQAASTKIKRIPNGQVAVTQALIEFTDSIALADKLKQEESLNRIARVLELQAWPKAEIVYMVPNRQLNYVPWSAIGLGQWVSVLPNGSWLLRTVKNSGKPATQLIVGDPDFGGELPQLTGARAEATAISRLYNVEPLLGKQATASAVLALAQTKLQVLHLATHGVFDYQKPLQSALYFSNQRGGLQAITAEDIFWSPLRADLVVLSACETGIGKVLEDNDIVGLLRSFYMNGASQTVNTLWPVSDQGVQQFMTVFHEHLHLGTGAAINKAVQASKRAGHPPSVYAAFVLNGYTPYSVAP